MTRVEHMALATPSLLARVQLLPAERMLAAVDPGYSAFSVAGTLHTQMNDGAIRFSGHGGVAPAGRSTERRWRKCTTMLRRSRSFAKNSS